MTMAKTIHDFSENNPVAFSTLVAGDFFKDSAGNVLMKMVPLGAGEENAVNSSTGVQSTIADATLVLAVDSELTFRGGFGVAFS